MIRVIIDAAVIVNASSCEMNEDVTGVSADTYGIERRDGTG